VELIKKTPASAPAPDRLDWPLSYIHVQWRECKKDVKIPGITGVVRYMRCNGRALPLRLRLADSRKVEMSGIFPDRIAEQSILALIEPAHQSTLHGFILSGRIMKQTKSSTFPTFC
jgi:hypothetical protein